MIDSSPIPDAPPAAPQWLCWQLLDSAFPIGAFAHSSGLEAAWRHQEVVTADQLHGFLDAVLRQAARFSLSLAMHAHRRPEHFETIDQTCNAMIQNHVANRASRAQGQGLLATADKSFAVPAIASLRAEVQHKSLPCHLAPVLGVVANMLLIDEATTAQMLMFLTLRGPLSAAVRLGIIGPFRAQNMQASLSPLAIELADRHRHDKLDEAAQTAPIFDLMHAAHDRLYSRLFHT